MPSRLFTSGCRFGAVQGIPAEGICSSLMAEAKKSKAAVCSTLGLIEAGLGGVSNAGEGLQASRAALQHCSRHSSPI